MRTSPAPAARPDLRGLQLLIWRLLTAPEGVASGLASLEAEGDERAARLPEWIAGDERLSAAERLDVYANMYFFRLKDALAEDFAKTESVLGEARFHNLVTDYLLAHPSEHWSLRYAGKALAPYLAFHPIAKDFPWLGDLAAFEYARADVFQAEDAAILSRNDLAAVAPEGWEGLFFRPVPALHLLRLSWAVDELWERLDEGGEAGDVAEGERSVLLFRDGTRARHQLLPPDEAMALRLLLSGRSFGEICERLLTAGDMEEAAARAAALLAGWVDRGLLASFAVV